ncbi:MAG: hypothetical protein K2Y22_14830 [Candidatus Obscuribacterales bacterium]|nr:hypothetical protein [Candidatus Obscuribacterales bacterium]
MKHKFISLFASFALVLGLLLTATPTDARGNACGRGGGASFCGTRGAGFDGCIRSPGAYGRGTVCGPYRGYHPRYGYGGGFGYGLGGWGYLPCYDGGSPYICDIKAPPPPPPPIIIYQGGTVVREYGKPDTPGGAPKVINVITASPGSKPTVIGK